MLRRYGYASVLFSLAILSSAGAYAAEKESSREVVQGFEQLRKTVPVLADALPIYLTTVQGSKVLNVSLFGKIPFPFSEVSAVLSRPKSYCDFLPVLFNVKACVITRTRPDIQIKYYVAGKHYTPPLASIRLNSRFRVMDKQKDYLAVMMESDEDSAGTSRYHVLLKAVPIDDQTLVSIESVYAPGRLTRMATYTYIKVFARDKPGFTRISVSGDSEQRYITGFPAVIERSIVRSYFALKAHLLSQPVAAGKRHEARLQSWYDLNLPHKLQLYELDRDQYLQIKRKERANQLEMQEKIDQSAVVKVGKVN